MEKIVKELYVSDFNELNEDVKKKFFYATLVEIAY